MHANQRGARFPHTSPLTKQPQTGTEIPASQQGGRFRGWSRAGHAPPRGAPAFRDDEHVQRRHQVAQRGLSRGGVRHERSRGGLFFEGRRRSPLERVAQRLERVAGGGRCEAKRLPRLRPPRERVAPLLLIMLLILVERTNERPTPLDECGRVLGYPVLLV